MPADWSNFILNVGNKLDSKSIEGSYDPNGRNVDDFSTYLTDQYISAIVNKAQSPYGNLHKKGNSDLIKIALDKSFKMLEDERSPTLEDKLSDPKYSDLKEQVPSINPSEYLDKFDLEFLKWVGENEGKITDFTYSIFFSQFPKFPTTREQQVSEIAKRILYNYDGSVDYLIWIATLRAYSDQFSDWASQVYTEVTKTLKGSFSLKIEPASEASQSDRGEIKVSVESNSKSGPEINVSYYRGLDLNIVTIRPDTIKKGTYGFNSDNIKNIGIAKKILQEEHVNNQQKIPDYLTREFISRFTYSPNHDNFNIFNSLGEDATARIGFFGIKYSKIEEYRLESDRYFALKQTYIKELSDNYAKQEDEIDQKDPYNVMAAGFLAYWASCLNQPLLSTPPVPPCLIPTPGTYIPVYLGSLKNLSSNLKRSFNTGKTYKGPGSGKVVATALAFSFAVHLLELKFLYNGQIPTPSGTSPMIGFVPLVF